MTTCSLWTPVSVPCCPSPPSLAFNYPPLCCSAPRTVTCLWGFSHIPRCSWGQTPCLGLDVSTFLGAICQHAREKDWTVHPSLGILYCQNCKSHHSPAIWGHTFKHASKEMLLNLQLLFLFYEILANHSLKRSTCPPGNMINHSKWNT